MNIKKTGRAMLLRYQQNNFHKLHKDQAMTALNNIQAESGYMLSQGEIQMCNAYAEDILGSKKYAYWLYVYTAFSQEFKEGWIPDNYFGEIVFPIINNDLGELSGVKTLTNKLLKSHLFPDSVYKIRNTFYDNEYNVLEHGAVKKYLFDQNVGEFYLKLDDSGQGTGVSKVNESNFNLQHLLSLGNFVMQKPIIQHPWFEQIMPNGGATIRVTTVRTLDNRIETRAAKLRIANEESSIVKFNESIMVGINLKDESLGSVGLDTSWKSYQSHPISNFEFAGKTIPSIREAVRELEILHKQFIHYSIIGWDICINTEGKPEIIEWNAWHPDIKFHEVFDGPLFRDLGWESLWKE